ncbi:MAG TPA: 2-oxoacid:acceptor oxidoreductase subunit alpha [Anaerolineales bacterium]|nr:2-oxoacid:acceptor oxidoreductase subunit alpha [Anaerolineales bacterium]
MRKFMTEEPTPQRGPVVNDFSITVGTVNGSGSQTSNLTILRALFKMGIPISGKNLFPSNIQGLPTWYTIRVSKDGYLARRDEHEIVIAMNPASFSHDLADCLPGGIFIYDEGIKQAVTRDDISVYPIPVKALTNQSDAPAKLRGYVGNMVYVGVLAQLLGIDLDKIHQALDFHFSGKEKPIALNMQVIQLAYDWAAENLTKTDPYRVEAMDGTKDYIMADGNTATALGTIYGGVQFVGWYPITPATSVPEEINANIPKLRTTPEGKATYAVVQAEDELAAIGMIIGAGWAGLRAMTATSGPGISLMAEYTSLAYFAEVPIVVWNVQRMGPSTGLPTRTSQGDINLCYYLGHGDTKHPVLLPGSVTECFEFGWKALDIAEQLQTPVFALSDLDFGMNHWMTKPFEYPDQPINRGKILWEEDLDNWDKPLPWGRYLDIDGDGIPYRTVVGNRHPKSAYFTRGTGHDDYANYSEDPTVWAKNMERLNKKFETARAIVPGPELHPRAGAKIGIIAFGSTDPAIREACDYLEADGIPVDYLRLRALPINGDVRSFMETHERIYVVEMNRDGQLHQILQTELPEYSTKLLSLSHNDGLPITANWVKAAITEEENK